MNFRYPVTTVTCQLADAFGQLADIPVTSMAPPRSLRRHPDGVGELANGERELTNSVGELVVGELICRRRDR